LDPPAFSRVAIPRAKTSWRKGESRAREKREKVPDTKSGQDADGHDGGSPMKIEQLAAAVLTTLLCGAADMTASPAG